MPTEAAIAQGLALIVKAARAGKRAPLNHGIKCGGISAAISSILVKRGQIKVEVYPRNYRVIEVTSGPHAGARTAAPPNPKWNPYRVLKCENAGSRSNGASARAPGRAGGGGSVCAGSTAGTAMAAPAGDQPARGA